MEVKTKSNGIVNVKDEQLVTFPEGLLGFEKYTKFALIDSEYEPFIWLQSLDESALAFLMIDPFIINPDFEVDIDDKELGKIGIKDPSDVLVMTIVTVPNDGSPVTANLRGPVIINKKTHEGMQAILNDPKWTTKFDIVSALAGKEDK